MFTGIVADVGKVAKVTARHDVRRLSLETRFSPERIAIGASIACSGICLTVISRSERHGGGSVFEVDLGPETLRVTTAGEWVAGTSINLESSLRIGEELGGHMVSGHVDGITRVVAREVLGEATRFAFEVPDQLVRFIAPKGSVALDGTSLTVNGVSGNRFDCMFIPHTLEVTNWGERQVGDKVNLEVDQIARYVARLLETAASHG